MIGKPGWRQPDPFVRVEDVRWQGGKLVVIGSAYVPAVNIRKRRHTSKILVLRPLGRRGRPMVLPARSYRHLEANAWSGQKRYEYDWAGFECAIDPRRFRRGQRWTIGEWDALLLVRGRAAWRAIRLTAPPTPGATVPGDTAAGTSASDDPVRSAGRQVAPGIRLGAYWQDGHLQVHVARSPAELRECRLDGGDLTIEVDVASVPAAEPGLASEPGLAVTVLAVTGPDGAVPRPLATTATSGPGGGLRLRATVPAAGLRDGAGGPGLVAERRLWVVATGSEPAPVAFAADGQEHRFADGVGEILIERTGYGDVSVVRREQRPVLDGHAWSDGTLTLCGRYCGPSGPQWEAVLARKDSTDTHVLPVTRDGDRFTVAIDVAAMVTFGTRQPLRDGDWRFSVRPAAPPGEDPIPLTYDPALAAAAGDHPRLLGHKVYTFTVSERGLPLVKSAAALGLVERGRVQRRLLHDLYYPVQRRRPMRDSVVFVSWKGKQCTDNPLGIADALRRRGDDREQIWVVTDWSVPVPAGATTVLSGTAAYWEALARSKYLISNDDMPPNHVKRDGQFYTQTWHGTLLKKIGFDVTQLQSIAGHKYLAHLAQEVTKWDLLLSPNPFSTPLMRKAFRYDGEICDSGYPRNDVLFGADVDRLSAEVRARLGLPAGKRVVLYAPTWRDNRYYASGRYRFDARLDIEQAWKQLGDDYVILMRGHHHTADDVPAGVRPGFVLNVTGYPSISELFLVSDVLVTDYSSAMVDFAGTGKPMVFFTYDLEDYRDDLRGFYFDFETEVPGPLLTTSDRVIAALADLDAVRTGYQAKYRAFRDKFCSLDDGHAGERACERIFGG
jgi:CDP-glycerol glycerophosphotransferase